MKYRRVYGYGIVNKPASASRKNDGILCQARGDWVCNHTGSCASVKAREHAAPPTQSGPNTNVICHAPGETCLGCDHYYGKAAVCKYADIVTPGRLDGHSALRVKDGDLETFDPHPPSELPLTHEQVESFRKHHISMACHTNYKQTNIDNKKQVNSVCDHALIAINLKQRVAEFERENAKLKARLK
mgnify:FL=1